MGYLEWGNNYTFLFQAEIEIVLKLFTDSASVIHPFTVLPLIGQIILVVTLFQKEPNKLLTYISIGSLGLLLGLMFVIGIIRLNIKILLSTIPFIVIAALTIKNYRLKKRSQL